MKNLSLILSLFISLFVVNSFAATNANEYKAMFNFNHGSGFQNDQLGTKVIKDTVRDLKVTYDFAVSGGAIASAGFVLPVVKTAGSVGAASGKLPNKAIVVGCYIDVLTPLTTSASGTMALGTGQTQTDLLGATAAASYTGIVACTPTGSAATSIKLTADRSPIATIATGAITAGKFNLHILYVLSD